MKMQAELWEKLPDGAVRCDLCFRHCRIGLGEKGFCAVRVNEDGRLLTLVGDSVVSISLDPVEKSRSIIFFRRRPRFPLARWAATLPVFSARIIPSRAGRQIQDVMTACRK